VDGVALSIVCILVKEDDGWTRMGMDKANSSHQREVSDGLDSLMPATLALWKSDAEMARMSEPDIPPLAPPSMGELRAGMCHGWKGHIEQYGHWCNGRRFH
jgi:hypothetical protein